MQTKYIHVNFVNLLNGEEIDSSHQKWKKGKIANIKAPWLDSLKI